MTRQTERSRAARGTWTEDEIVRSAKGFASKTEWRKSFPGAYIKAHRLGLLELCSSHMDNGKLHGFWTIERISEAAAKYLYIKDFRAAAPGAYAAALRFGIWPQLEMRFSKMERDRIWHKEACIADARRFQRRSEWALESEGAYRSALKNDWLDDCCLHMEKSYTKLSRFIYAIYNKNEFYVGLSWVPIKRYQQHCRSSDSSARKLTEGFHCFEILGGPYSEDEAGGYEAQAIADFLKLGKSVTNRSKAGSLGAREVIWTYDACLIDALRFTDRSAWRSASGSGYDVASKKGWLKQCCAHMGHKKVDWSDDEILATARLYTSKRDWRAGSPQTYDIAVRRRSPIFHLATEHMPENLREKWTEGACLSDAQLYSSRKQWRDASPSAVAAAKRLKIYDACVAHMGNRLNER